MADVARGAMVRLAIGWSTMFMIGSDLFVVSPLLPLIASEYRVSPRLAGLAVTVFALAYTFAAPLFGHLADRIGRRYILTFCLLAFAAANLVTASAADFSWLLPARLLAGIAAAGVSPSVYALVSSSTLGQRRASWLALAVSGLLVSLVLGAPLGELAGATIGWRSVFVGLAFFSLPLAWVNARIWPADEAAGNTTPQPEDLTVGILVPRLAPMVAWSTALYGMYTYLGVGLTTAGLSTGQIAGVIWYYGYGAIGGILLGGRVADLLGARLTRRLSLAGLCASFLVLRLAVNAGVLIEFTFGLVSAVAQMFFPAQQSALVNDFPQRRASVLAWNNSALFLGISLGSLVGGQAVAIGGFPADLTSSAMIALAGWALTGATAGPRRAVGRAQ